MATILEGLNAISQAVGGTGEAESNLEALNQISGALGGSADATENADAIANIAENASGGGGSSDFSTATVTLKSSVSSAHSENDTIVFVAHGEDGDGHETVTALYKYGTNYTSNYEFDVTTPEQVVDVLMCGESFIIWTLHPMAATGSASVETTTDPINGTVYEATVTGDCVLTISEGQ